MSLRLRTSLYRSSRSEDGFSLIELLVTIAIIGLMTALVMVKYGAFNSTTLLGAQAYDVALQLRDAQSRAINVRSANTEFRAAYGIHFSGGTGNYQLFIDTDGDGEFDEGEELGDTFTLDERFTFSALCAGNPCSSGNTTGALSVTFARPDFDARIVNESGTTLSSLGRIELSAKRGIEGMTRAVVVYPSGQIAVD